MHGAQILPFLGAPFERFDLFRVGWGGAHGSRTALALYGVVLVFRALSPFVRSGTAVLRVRHTQLRAAPRSHAGCSCCRARLRVRRACYPITVRDKPPMNFGGDHPTHGLQFGQAPRGRRSGVPGWPCAPAPRGPGGCCHRGRSPLRTTDRKLPGPGATAR